MGVLFAILIASAALNSQEPEREIFQDWFVLNESDPLTDLSRGLAATTADSGGTLVIKCDILNTGPSDMYVSYVANGFLGEGRNNGRRELIYRVDDSEPVRVTA